MKTNVIGYPRIGEQRELKKAIESYFKSDISKEDLLEIGKSLRIKHWSEQKNSNINYISSNDFSFYDTSLDNIVLFNAIPKEYKILDGLDKYFALAKGYQNKEINLKALPMKKWFNTNYHYLVTTIDENTEFKLNPEKIISEFLEAKEKGILTKPVVIGPLTFLKLANIKGNYTKYLDRIVPLYRELFEKLLESGAQYIQIDEPILVTDLNQEDIEAFERVYRELLEGDIKIILQTYFGDIRDIYEKVKNLDFYGLGLDFVEGKENLELISEFGWNENTILFAGIINGKNIWKAHYAESLDIINKLRNKISSIVIGTSCSLLHVPYTLEFENKLNAEYKEHLAFAKEKLIELKEISEILDTNNIHSSKFLIENIGLHRRRKELKEFYSEELRKLVKNLKEEDFQRPDTFEKRIEVQRNNLNLPLLPTTTIGSFPQTNEVRKIRNSYKKGLISVEEYEFQIKEKIKEVVKLQENIDLDVLVHGEFERNDMVEYFGENLSGFLFTENAWVQSYGHRCVKPPIIFGDVERKESISVKWSTFAKSLTDKPMKGMLTGPITIENWSFVREDISLKEIAYQIALAIGEEVKELEENGINIIQIDEAALREKLPLRKSDWNDYLDWAIKAFKLTNTKVLPSTQIHTHMCYSEFKDIINEIKALDADVITIEAAKSDLEMLDTLKCACYDKEVGPGVYDIHSHRVPCINEFKENIKAMINKLELKNLWVNPDCGLKTRGEKETVEALTNMVLATKELRKEINLSL